MEKYFSKSTEDLLKEFKVSKNGLNDQQILEGFKLHGFNELRQKKKQGIIEVFFSQFKDLLIFILIMAGVISILSNNLESTIVIFSVIILNAVLGTLQHFKAEKSLDSLKALSAPCSKVIRNGERIEIQSRNIVPGDILVLEAGDLIAADGRVLESYSLQVNESSITGESLSVDKSDEKLESSNIALGDQKNMVFSGSLVTYGRALVLVTNTGMKTEIGKIATLIDETQKKKTPLQVSLDDFSKKLAIIILAICVGIFLLSIYREMPIIDSLMFAVALAVAAIPEALSSIVTIVLALGTQKMAKENAIVKKLRAVEGLGSVSIICSDKTGTLTQNKMTVREVYVDKKLIKSSDISLDNKVIDYLIKNSILCNDSTSNDGNEIGDPTEIALVNLGEDISVDEVELREKYKRLSEIPFDSERKLMSTLHKIDNKNIMFTKGALDVILNRVKFIMTSDGIKELSEDDKNDILNINKKLSENGLRVLSFAYRELEEIRELTLDDEYDYIFIGLISMIDPPRVESKEAVSECIKAGIKPIMITGDHKITASAIAKEIGILRDGDRAIEGIEIDSMSDDDLIDNIEHISVYARVSPEHKIRIVKAWQKKGQIVAMTGDGVNDAPALKQADIGIAMGITGTEVSKDAASMILTDDNFATIVKSISNGRSIYNNIKNSIKFLLSGNTSGIIAVLYTSIMALPMPFAAVHLLFINLLTDSLPAIAIGMEESGDEVLKDKPRGKNESILNKSFLLELGIEGLLIGIFTIISFYLGNPMKTPMTASTMAFATLCLARLFHGFNCRGKGSIFRIGILSNKYSLLAFVFGVILLNSVLFIPVLQSLFEVESLAVGQYIMVYILSLIPTLIIQLVKVIYEKNKNNNNNSTKVEGKLENIA